MLNTKMKRSALSLILAVVLMFSVFSVSVFAETEAEVDGTETEAVETEAVTDGTTTDDGHDHDHDHEDEEEKKGLSTFDIVSLIILGVLIIVGVVYCIKNREKVGKFLRSLKSEFKKVSWLSGEQTRKSTFVVVVILVIFAAVIGLLDMGLFKLFELILDAFDSLLNGTVG